MNSNKTFRSFIFGGFECSTHRRRDGRRLDLIHSTRHDEFARSDYELLQRHGMSTARDGVRWHVIEQSPGRLDFSSAIPLFQAAHDTSMHVLWDLWHYGWPDHLDIFSTSFIDHFAAFARETAAHLSDYCEQPFVSPINEISFFSGVGGEVGFFNPFAHHRGDELKR